MSRDISTAYLTVDEMDAYDNVNTDLSEPSLNVFFLHGLSAALCGSPIFWRRQRLDSDVLQKLRRVATLLQKAESKPANEDPTHTYLVTGTFPLTVAGHG